MTNTNVNGTISMNDFSKYAVNGAYAKIHDEINAAKDRMFMSRAKHNFTIVEIVPFVRPDRNNRIGHIVFQAPVGSMQVKHWNGQAIEWLEMSDFDYDGFRPTRSRLMHGSGFLKLAIKEGYNGVPFISWPREKGKVEGQWWDVFKASNAGSDFFHSDNCYNIQAALATYLLTYWGEFKQADPRNRFGFNEHCGNCRHNIYMPIHDQMGDDYENKANPIDTSELTQYGSRMPQWVCGVHGDFTDQDAIDDMNEYAAYEVTHYFDRDTGAMRWLRPNEVMIKGVPVSTYKVRADGTAERCATCPFYAKNERKPDKSVGAELVKAREESGWAPGGKDPFVAKYWTERAQTNRMPVFTQVEGNGANSWKLGFPGQFENPVAFMVQGFGGIEVYGVPELSQTMKRDFVPTTEAYKEDDAKLAKLINIIHNTCNKFDTIEPDTLDALLAMVTMASAQPMSDPLKTRYVRALARLGSTIEAHE